LASYTWEQDALRWGSLEERERIAEAVTLMERIFPVSKGMFEIGTTQIWSQSPFSGGAFAYFLPNQWRDFYGFITQEESNIYFVGEHASVTHGWIHGAMASALDACIKLSAKLAQHENEEEEDKKEV